MRSSGTRGRPELGHHARGIADPAGGGLAARELRRAIEAAAELLGEPAHGDGLGSRDVDRRGRPRGAGEAAQRHGVGVALPDDVDMAHGEVDGLPVAHLGGDVVQDAVAHVDCVVEADDAAGGAEAGGEMLEHALAAGAGVGIVARRRDRRRLLGGAAAVHGHERIDAPRGEGDDARGREGLGDDGRGVHVHGPGQRRIARGAELHGRHVDEVVELRQRFDAAAVEQIALDRLDTCLIERAADGRVGEARHADDALLGRGPLGHAGERRAHLAGDAENEDVAVDGGEVCDQLRRRLRHKVFERRDALEAVGQARRGHARFLGEGGRNAPLRRRRHRPHGRKVHVGGDGKAGTGERAEGELAALDAQAGRAGGAVVEIGVGAGEGGLLALRRERHAVDEMMAVALDVGQPQQRHQRQVLLHAHACQRGQVLGRHEILVARRLRALSLATRAALRMDL